MKKVFEAIKKLSGEKGGAPVSLGKVRIETKLKDHVVYYAYKKLVAKGSVRGIKTREGWMVWPIYSEKDLTSSEKATTAKTGVTSVASALATVSAVPSVVPAPKTPTEPAITTFKSKLQEFCAKTKVMLDELQDLAEREEAGDITSVMIAGGVVVVKLKLEKEILTKLL